MPVHCGRALTCLGLCIALAACTSGSDSDAAPQPRLLIDYPDLRVATSQRDQLIAVRTDEDLLRPLHDDSVFVVHGADVSARHWTRF